LGTVQVCKLPHSVNRAVVSGNSERVSLTAIPGFNELFRRREFEARMRQSSVDGEVGEMTGNTKDLCGDKAMKIDCFVSVDKIL
jgi:hypothetical protein